MSKEKVDAYREQKKHRKENLAKERAKKKALKIGGYLAALVVACGIVGAIGLTGWNSYKAAEAAKPDYSSTSQVINDYNGVTAEEEAAEDAEAETEAE